MSAKPKARLKPRRMWATEQCFTKPGIAEKLLREEGMQYYFTVPVAVIPLDDVVRMLAVAACAGGMRIEQAHAALTAVGVLPKGRAK